MHLRPILAILSEIVKLELQAAFAGCAAMRDPVTQHRRPFLRFFACQEDLSHELPDAPLPEAVASGGGAP